MQYKTIFVNIQFSKIAYIITRDIHYLILCPFQMNYLATIFMSLNPLFQNVSKEKNTNLAKWVETKKTAVNKNTISASDT